jgi:hypothetical protein
MKPVKLFLVLPLLAVLPIRASEVGVLIDKQWGSSQSVVYFNDPDLGNGSMNIGSANPTGIGIRGALTLVDFHVAELGLTATWRPQSTTSLNADFTSSVIGQGSAKFADYKYGYLAVGAQFDWKLAVDVHVGLDLRMDTLTTSFVGGDSHDTNYTRPWVSCGIGYTFPAPVVKPFIRLEAAVAMTNAGTLSTAGSDDDFNKAFAPKYQIALYGGIRF